VGLKSLHVHLLTTYTRNTVSMSMSKVLSSDSSEHSTPLSDNKGRHGTNIIPLLSSVSVLDNADNNAELSAHQPSPIVSRDLISCSIVLHPQKCLVKFPSAQSSTTPTTSFSKYTRRPSLAFQQQKQDRDHQCSQPPLSPGALARHGIKVRDFAYESDLPLIPSIPRARKVVLGAQPLKRTKRYFEEPDDIFTVDTHCQSQSATAGLSQGSTQQDESVNKSRPLERKSTEPVIIPERKSQRPYRDVGHADFSQHPSSSQAAQRSPRHTLTPATPVVTRTPTNFSPASLPFPFPATKRLTAGGGSQESELSTDTPLVTPKGSLTWPSPSITGGLPASQLDNNGSQAPVLDTVPTYLQLGFSPPFSQAPDSHPDTDTATVDTSLGSLPPTTTTTEVDSSLLQPPLDHLAHTRASSPPSPSPSRTRRSRTSRPLTEPGPNTGGQRYFLRKHGSPEQDRDSSPSQLRRRKSSIKRPAPYPGRVPPVTRQSAHAASSNSPGRSARARPLRKATTS